MSANLKEKLQARREACSKSPRIFFSLVNNKTDVHPQPVEADWKYITALLEKPNTREIKDGAGWLFAKFKDDGGRNNVNVELLYGFVGDVDNKAVVENPHKWGYNKENRRLTRVEIDQRLNGYTYALHTTFSHTTEVPRYRFVIPFTRPVTADEHRRVYDHFQTLFDGALDSKCETPSQFWYLPSCPAERLPEFEFKAGDGELFNPDTLLPSDPKEDRRNRAEALKRRANRWEQERSPAEMDRLIERVCDALPHIPADDRDVWLKVGMALHHSGLPQWVWDEWAKTCPEKYDQRDQDYTWSKFKAGHAQPVSLGTVFHWAKEHGWIGETTSPEIIVRHGVLDWALLATQKAPPIRYHINHWLGPWPTLLAGRGGSGKTLLAQMLGTTLPMGLDYIDATTESAKVLLWACEDDHDELWRRQEKICEHLQVPMADLAGQFILEARRGLDNELFVMSHGGKTSFTDLLYELEEQIHDNHVQVVELDNVGQVYGGNENDRHQVTKFINGVIGTARDKAIAFIFVAHPAKSEGSEYAGSAAWENAVRMRWYLGETLPDEQPKSGSEASVNDNIRYLCKRKTNYTEKDYRRFTFQKGVLVPERIYQDTDGTAAMREEVNARTVLIEGFKKLEAMGEHPHPGKNSPYFLPKLIVEKGLANGINKAALTRALNRLMAEGVFRRGEVGSYGNRHKREGLVWTGN